MMEIQLVEMVAAKHAGDKQLLLPFLWQLVFQLWLLLYWA
jgi:hypothetical protein